MPLEILLGISNCLADEWEAIEEFHHFLTSETARERERYRFTLVRQDHSGAKPHKVEIIECDDHTLDLDAEGYDFAFHVTLSVSQAIEVLGKLIRCKNESDTTQPEASIDINGTTITIIIQF